jgi:hypothetical protein
MPSRKCASLSEPFRWASPWRYGPASARSAPSSGIIAQVIVDLAQKRLGSQNVADPTGSRPGGSPGSLTPVSPGARPPIRELCANPAAGHNCENTRPLHCDRPSGVDDEFESHLLGERVAYRVKVVRIEALSGFRRSAPGLSQQSASSPSCLCWERSPGYGSPPGAK